MTILFFSLIGYDIRIVSVNFHFADCPFGVIITLKKMFVFVLQRNQKCSPDFFETNPFKLFLFSSKCIMSDLTERYEMQKKFVLLPVCFSFGINCSDELEDIVR